MIDMDRIRPDLEKITRLIKNTLDLEAAVFDTKSRLLACTDDYLRHKGETVHAPSIDEVVANGNVMVNRPGHMATCTGCRFIGNCPAKIEILQRIRAGEKNLGAMALTTFSQAGHDRITHDTQTYVETLGHFTSWIGNLAADLADTRHQGIAAARPLLKEVMALSADAFLAVDPRGDVLQCNASAHEFFAFCDLYTRSLYHILPQALVEKILGGERIKEARLVIHNKTAWLSANPVFDKKNFTGAIICFGSLDASPQKPSRPPRTSVPRAATTALIGESPPMEALKATIHKLSPSDSTLLITGETGTGKGLLAKVIHATGKRSKGPFVPVNCTSIPDTLFESELFGYEEGAFTGAKKGGKPGRFELAQGGTLFLDEIGEMPLHMQVKLLNVLQDFSLQRVGGITPVPIDVRIIAATNQDLYQLMAEKKFRADLFYRLNVIPMELPPLARRQQDIPLLARAFLEEFNPKAGKNIQEISPPVMERLLAHPWPGNIRELQNIMEYSINMEEGPAITLSSLPAHFLGARFQGVRFHEIKGETPAPGGEFWGTGINVGTDTRTDIKTRVISTEKATILACLDRHGHHVEGKKKTAEELGISLRTLYRKLAAK